MTLAATLREADLFRSLPKGFVQCRACAHYCALPEGGAGKCGVRRNLGGRLYLVTYGKAAALHLDPVEKKPLYHFHPGEGILSVGTVGCNLFCAFCQNWQISQFREFRVSPEGRLDRPIGEDWPPKRLVAEAEALGVRLLAYTYNEPALHHPGAEIIHILVWLRFSHSQSRRLRAHYWHQLLHFDLLPCSILLQNLHLCWNYCQWLHCLLLPHMLLRVPSLLLLLVG